MKKNTNWELKIAENMGELLGTYDSEEVVVPTKQLITDMKAQLMFLPKNFTWTVGWRTYVWQEKETGRFKELTQEEYDKLINGGTLNNPTDGGGSDNEVGPTEGAEG
jgi:hypothetical protein